MSAVITPTPGRVVWYWPAANDNIPALSGQPLAAIVAAVHSDRYINLSVIDAYGHHHSRQSVFLVQPDDEAIPESRAEWMPYQIGQALKNAEQSQEVTMAEDGDSLAEQLARTSDAEYDGPYASETGLVNTATGNGENDAPVSNITTEAKL